MSCRREAVFDDPMRSPASSSSCRWHCASSSISCALSQSTGYLKSSKTLSPHFSSLSNGGLVTHGRSTKTASSLWQGGQFKGSALSHKVGAGREKLMSRKSARGASCCLTLASALQTRGGDGPARWYCEETKEVEGRIWECLSAGGDEIRELLSFIRLKKKANLAAACNVRM